MFALSNDFCGVIGGIERDKFTYFGFTLLSHMVFKGNKPKGRVLIVQ